MVRRNIAQGVAMRYKRKKRPAKTRRPTAHKAKRRIRTTVGGRVGQARRVRPMTLISGPATMPMAVRGSGQVVVQDIASIPIDKATPGHWWVLRPSWFARRLSPMLALYDQAQLMSLSVQYINLVSTGRDGLMYIGWDNDSTSVPGTFGGMLVHQNKRQVRLWEPSPVVNIPLTASKRRVVPKNRFVTSNSFVISGDSEMAVGYYHEGIDASAPAVLGHLVIRVAVRLTEPSAPAGADNGVVEEYDPERSQSVAAPMLAVVQAPVPATASDWVSDPGPIERALPRPPSTAPPVGPAMAAARMRRERSPSVGPAKPAGSEEQ